MPLNLAQVPQKRVELEACSGKAAFRSWDAAGVVARRMSRSKTARLTPYRCPFCDLWHVGRELKKSPRR